MQLTPEISFKGMPASPAVEAKIREKVATLDRYYDRIMSCRVIVEAPHRHRQKGKIYEVRIDLTVPSGEVVVNRSAAKGQAHEDIYVALRDAFSAARRQLQNHGRRQRGKVKAHEAPPHGSVVKLFPESDYGFIHSSDGREIYFHRNSVVNNGFETLEIGSEVRFVESEGVEGAQASTVTPVGKHHIVE